MNLERRSSVIEAINESGFTPSEVVAIISDIDDLEVYIDDLEYQKLAFAIELHVRFTLARNDAVRGGRAGHPGYSISETEHSRVIEYLEQRVFHARRTRLEKALNVPVKVFHIKWDEKIKDFRYV